MNQNKKRNLALALLLLALILFIYSFNSKPKRGSNSRPESSNLQDLERVNAHLFKTDAQIQLEKEKVKIENWKSAPKVGENLFPKKDKKTQHDLDFSADQRERQVLSDLEINEKQIDYVSPHSQIQSQLSAEQAQVEYEAEYKKEYARQFVENARKAGYEVVLDENYMVISVKKIRPEDRGQLFKNQSGGSQ